MKGENSSQNDQGVIQRQKPTSRFRPPPRSHPEEKLSVLVVRLAGKDQQADDREEGQCRNHCDTPSRPRCEARATRRDDDAQGGQRHTCRGWWLVV